MLVDVWALLWRASFCHEIKQSGPRKGDWSCSISCTAILKLYCRCISFGGWQWCCSCTRCIVITGDGEASFRLRVHPDAEQVKPKHLTMRHPGYKFRGFTGARIRFILTQSFPSSHRWSVMNEDAAIKKPYLPFSPRMSLESLRYIN